MARTVVWDATSVNENSGGTPQYVWERGAPNVQKYKTIMQANVQEYFNIASRSGWMYNDKGIQYDGLKYAEVPILETSGLGDYRRNQGYALGAANLKYEKFEVKMDRSTHISVDRMDLDETGFLASTSRMMRHQMDNYIIPEIDSYNYSAVYKKVLADVPTNITNTAVDASKLLDELRLKKAKIDNEFSVNNLAYFMSPITASYLTNKYEHIMSMQDFNNGSIFSKVKTIDGVPIFEVPQLRFKTEYIFEQGTTNPEEVELDKLGFKPSPMAEDMLYMIAPMDCAQAFTKVNVTKLLTPEESTIDSWEAKFRIVYDCWLKQSDAQVVNISTGTLNING